MNVKVRVNDMHKALRLYELAMGAKGTVSVEQGQWRAPVVSPLGFFGLAALNMNEPMTVYCDDEEFFEKLKKVPDLVVE